MDTYADDLAALMDELDLKDVILVGHSTGGEVARYIGRHGSAHVAKVVLVDAIPPLIKIYPGAPHGLTATHKGQLNADLLAFLQS